MQLRWLMDRLSMRLPTWCACGSPKMNLFGWSYSDEFVRIRFRFVCKWNNWNSMIGWWALLEFERFSGDFPMISRWFSGEFQTNHLRWPVDLKIEQIRSHSSQRPDRQNRLMPSSPDYELPQLCLVQHVHGLAFARLKGGKNTIIVNLTNWQRHC